MMGPRQEAQTALFYDFSIEAHVPGDHVLRAIDDVIDLSSVRVHLTEFYSSTGRPSVDSELMMRMLPVGYVMCIRAERRLCEEVHLNLAYRWFCKLNLTDPIPDHSTFSRTATVDSAIAMCCAMCLKRWSRNASNPVWQAGNDTQPMPASLPLTLTVRSPRRRRTGIQRRLILVKRHVRFESIWKHLMTPRLAPPVHVLSHPKNAFVEWAQT